MSLKDFQIEKAKKLNIKFLSLFTFHNCLGTGPDWKTWIEKYTYKIRFWKIHLWRRKTLQIFTIFVGLAARLRDKTGRFFLLNFFSFVWSCVMFYICMTFFLLYVWFVQLVSLFAIVWCFIFVWPFFLLYVWFVRLFSLFAIAIGTAAPIERPDFSNTLQKNTLEKIHLKKYTWKNTLEKVHLKNYTFSFDFSQLWLAIERPEWATSEKSARLFSFEIVWKALLSKLAHMQNLWWKMLEQSEFFCDIFINLSDDIYGYRSW